MTEQLRTIRFYGRLGARFGRVHRLAVKSAAEAVRALTSQLPGLERYLMESKDRGEGYAIFYGKTNLAKEELHNPSGNEDIRFAPMLMGAKSGGVLNIIIGAILVVVGVFVPALGPYLIPLGISMMVGGVVQLLTPVPKGRSAKDRPENTPSYSFNGPINTQAQGNPVPLLYGRLIVGSAVVSAGIDAQDQAYVPVGGPGNAGGGGGARWSDEYNGSMP